MEDHDQRLKVLLKEFFAEFMQLFFPQWAERFDFTRIEWLDKEVFPDPPHGERRSVDLVAKVPVKEPAHPGHGVESKEWIVLVHVEVESADSIAAFRPRMFQYYCPLRQSHRLPILPIGLFLRVGLDGIGWDVYEERFWEHTIIDFEYAYIGLPALDAVEYMECENVLGIALAALMRIPEDQKAILKAEAMERLAKSAQNEWRRFLLCECVDAYLPLTGPTLEQYENLLLSEKYKEANMVGMTTYEKGMAKGEVEGQRKTIQRQLEKRFGHLGSSGRHKLAALSVEQLEQLSVNLIDATSLRELGLEE